MIRLVPSLSALLHALALIVLVLPASASGGDTLDVASWLKRPGVKLLAVDFYADWCEPCNEALPHWQRLVRDYHDQGLRVIIVTVQSKGQCLSLPWTPDDIVCDTEGYIAEAWGAQALPQAFLWNWKGDLLAAHAEVDTVETAVKGYFDREPRILVNQPTDSMGKPLPNGADVYDLVRTELRRSSKFVVVADQREMSALLETQRKVETSAAFKEESKCKVGEAMPPNTALDISLGSMRETHRLRLNVLSLEKGCLVASSSVTVGSSLEKATAEAIAALVAELGGKVTLPDSGADLGRVTVSDFSFKDDGRSIQNPIVDETGFLFVESDPKGAAVLINGVEKGTTPYQAELMAGKYVVTCRKDLHKPVQKEVQLGTKGAKLTMQLPADYGILTVDSLPQGAAITINGEPTQQKTPFTFQPKKTGRYTVSLSLDKYFSTGAKVSLADGARKEVRLELKPNFGSLRVASQPAGGMVLLDGQETGRAAPITLTEVGAGLHEVSVRSEQYRSKPQRVMVEVGQMATVEIPMEGLYGLLKVTAEIERDGQVEPVEADLFINGQKVGSTPYKDQLLVGAYTVEIRSEQARRPYSQLVKITEGQPKEVAAVLDGVSHVERAQEASPSVDSESISKPKGGWRPLPDDDWKFSSARRSDVNLTKVGVGLVIGGLAGLAAGGGSIGLSRYYEKKSAEADGYQDKAKTWKYIGWAGLGLGGALAVSGAVIWIYDSHQKSRFAILPAVDADHYLVSVAGRW